jgi:hypothetical protein
MSVLKQLLEVVTDPSLQPSLQLAQAKEENAKIAQRLAISQRANDQLTKSLGLVNKGFKKHLIVCDTRLRRHDEANRSLEGQCRRLEKLVSTSENLLGESRARIEQLERTLEDSSHKKWAEETATVRPLPSHSSKR